MVETNDRQFPFWCLAITGPRHGQQGSVPWPATDLFPTVPIGYFT